MRYSPAVVAALGFGVAQASVLPREPAGNPITDPVRLAELNERHDAVVGAFKTAKGPEDLAERRVPSMFHALYPGFLFFSRVVSILDNANSIASTLFDGWNNEVIWDSEDYCRAYFLSHGGGNCYSMSSSRTRAARATHMIGVPRVSWNMFLCEVFQLTCTAQLLLD